MAGEIEHRDDERSRTAPQEPFGERGDPEAEPPIHAGDDRPRGLDAWFAPGGEDEATEARRADERRNLRLLLAMVAALVLIPTLLTIVGLAQELIAGRGG